jgi:hypothetical protein
MSDAELLTLIDRMKANDAIAFAVNDGLREWDAAFESAVAENFKLASQIGEHVPQTIAGVVALVTFIAERNRRDPTGWPDQWELDWHPKADANARRDGVSFEASVIDNLANALKIVTGSPLR